MYKCSSPSLASLPDQHTARQHDKPALATAKQKGPDEMVLLGVTGVVADKDDTESGVPNHAVSAEGSVGSDVPPEALEILATLASLGICDTLRTKVQDALAELELAYASTSARAHNSSGLVAPGHAASSIGQVAVRDKGTATHDLKLAAAEHKLQMSRSIMRKLYHKNVALEKDLETLKAAQQPLALMDPWANSPPTSKTAMHSSALERPVTAYLPTGQLTPAAVALQEREKTIQQLQAALDAARRRCALLESSSVAAEGANRVNGRKNFSQESVKEVLAQSVMHFNKYRAIRDDYNRLLNRRAGSLQTGHGTGAAVRHVVVDLQQRLHSEVAEREAEAALYSARLYESERQLSDWYVEKHMLQDQITKLKEEAKERDRLDSEIEGCVCGLFERLRLLEDTNEELLAQLGEGSRRSVALEKQAGQGREDPEVVCAANLLVVRR